jgi:Glycosyltransferase Family 4
METPDRSLHKNYDPCLLALTRGYRTVFTVHDPVQHPGPSSLTAAEERVFKQWFRRAERFVVHGQALADELAPMVDRARIVLIPHGVRPLPSPSFARNRRASSSSAGSSSTRAWRSWSKGCAWCGATF